MAKEYGWTDDYIMDLPIRTLRQKIAVINRRLYLERRERISLMSWQTRQITTFEAGGYWVEGHNKALDQAQKLAYDKIEKAQLEEAAIAAENAPVEYDIRPGTYEKFMSSFGDDTRWAGR